MSVPSISADPSPAGRSPAEGRLTDSSANGARLTRLISNHLHELGHCGVLPSVRPTPPSDREEILGFGGFLALIILIDRFSNQVYPLRSAPLIYLVAVVLVAGWSGLRAGVLSGLLMVGYAWLITHLPFASPAMSSTVRVPAVTLISAALIYPIAATVAGIVQNKLRNAAMREYDAHSRARTESVQRRQAEAELWASEDMRRRIVDSSIDAIVGVTASGTITMWNPNAERTFGWTRDESIGVPIGLRISLLESPDEPGKGLRFDSNEELIAPQRSELAVVTKSGEEIAIEVYIAPHLTETGRSFIVFARDVSERKRAERAIQDLNVRLEERVAERTQQLQAANEELLGFTYTVSHDLRAPLRSIVLNSRIVCEEGKNLLTEDLYGNLKRLEAGALKMADLIDNLLRYARLAQVEIAAKDIFLSELAEAIGDELKLIKDGTVEVEPNMVAKGDSELIQLVLFNLMENAWKYVAPGEKPHIEVGQIPGGTFFVRDHGIGFDMKYAEKIWAPFERLHREGSYPGTGIGLANCKRIIQRHGGEIWAESSPGKGTTIFFRLAGKPKSRRTSLPTTLAA